MIQLTIIRIEGYGPWTLTLGSDREAQLQMLQAKIYHDVQKLFSEKNCIVFPNRFDEYFAVTNGLSVQDHVVIHQQLSNHFDNLQMSMAIGSGETAYEANMKAYEARKERKAAGNEKIFANVENGEDLVQIMHVDVDGSTKVGAKLSPYEVSALVAKIFSKLSDEFLKKQSLTFFLGGDNFMILSNGITKQEAGSILSAVTGQTGVKLNCGIGISKTGRKAAEAATKALDTIRDLRTKGQIHSIYEVQSI